MKGPLKFFIDIGPLIVFFIFYKKTNNIIDAIIPLIIATTIAILVSYIIEKKIPVMPTFAGILILFFGGLTLYFKDPIFIKMKPTIINILFAAILVGGNFFQKPLLKYILGSAINLQDRGWFELSKRWAMFFILLAILNEFIWRNFSDNIWVNFKVFGILILTIIFSATQLNLIKKYKKDN